MIKKNCLTCKEEFSVWPSIIKRGGGKFCSNKCHAKVRGGPIKKGSHQTESHRIKKGLSRRREGNKIITEFGYVLIKNRKHPDADCRGYVREHRLVMEHILGRYLRPEEVVHHDGTKYPMGSFEDKGDNRIENLKLFANDSGHVKYHHDLSP